MKQTETGCFTLQIFNTPSDMVDFGKINGINSILEKRLIEFKV